MMLPLLFLVNGCTRLNFPSLPIGSAAFPVLDMSSDDGTKLYHFHLRT